MRVSVCVSLNLRPVLGHPSFGDQSPKTPEEFREKAIQILDHLLSRHGPGCDRHNEFPVAGVDLRGHEIIRCNVEPAEGR